MRKIFIKKVLGTAFKTFLISVLFFVGVIFVEYQKQKKDFDKRLSSQTEIYQKVPQKGMIKVLGEEDETGEKQQGELYAISNINFAGETLASMNNDRKEEEIEVFNIQGRVYKNEVDEEINYLTSWQSNKPTISTIEYLKEGAKEVEKIEESSYNYINNIVFPGIDFSSVYKYVIKSKDRWGNETQTGQFIFYTGPEEASFFNLLENSLLESFGWVAGR